MPGLSGFEVLETMKSRGLLSKIPVIVLTSEKSSEMRLRAGIYTDSSRSLPIVQRFDRARQGVVGFELPVNHSQPVRIFCLSEDYKNTFKKSPEPWNKKNTQPDIKNYFVKMKLLKITC